MSEYKGGFLNKFLTVLGAVLIIVSIVFCLQNFIFQDKYSENALKIAQKIDTLLPDYKDTFKPDISNKLMPTIEVDGIDFVGKICIYGIAENKQNYIELPVKAQWDKKSIKNYPCRFSGSIYSGNLIIGGSDTKGQFQFIKNLTIGDNIFITDTVSNRFCFVVSDIFVSKNVSNEYLNSKKFDLLLFSKNNFGFNYNIILCNFKN